MGQEKFLCGNRRHNSISIAIKSLELKQLCFKQSKHISVVCLVCCHPLREDFLDSQFLRLFRIRGNAPQTPCAVFPPRQLVGMVIGGK